jgi:hypothetical protein
MFAEVAEKRQLNCEINEGRSYGYRVWKNTQASGFINVCEASCREATDVPYRSFNRRT